MKIPEAPFLTAHLCYKHRISSININELKLLLSFVAILSMQQKLEQQEDRSYNFGERKHFVATTGFCLMGMHYPVLLKNRNNV